MFLNEPSLSFEPPLFKAAMQSRTTLGGEFGDRDSERELVERHPTVKVGLGGDVGFAGVGERLAVAIVAR